MRILLSIAVFLIPFIVTELILSFSLPVQRRDFFTYHSSGYLWSASDTGYFYSRFGQNGKMFVRFNQHGERSNQNYDYKKPKKTFRILVLGDSLTFGQHLSVEQTWTSHLQDDLLRIFPTKKIEVINCAVITLNLLELYDLWKKRCSQYEEVDLTLVQTSISDEPASFALLYGEYLGRTHQIFSFLYQYYKFHNDSVAILNMKKRFQLDEFGLPLLETTPEERYLYQSYFRPVTSLFYISNIARAVEQQLVWPHRLRFIPNRLPLNYSSSCVPKFNEFCTAIDCGYSAHPPDFEAAISILRKWKQELDIKGSRLLVVNLPNSMGLNIREDLADRIASLGSSIDHTSEKLMRRRALAEVYKNYLTALRRHDIANIDFVKILGEQPTKSNFIDGDVHLNEHGHMQVSKSIAKYIDESQGTPGH